MFSTINHAAKAGRITRSGSCNAAMMSRSPRTVSLGDWPCSPLLDFQTRVTTIAVHGSSVVVNAAHLLINPQANASL